MPGKQTKNRGLKALLKKERRKFASDENRLHYSEADFKKAERKYLQVCVIKGLCQS
jgi:hypothetical protein